MNKTNKKLKSRIKSLSGLLVIAPRALKESNIDFLLISNDGDEYHLIKNRKTFKMTHLVDTRVQVTALFGKTDKEEMPLRVINYKCLDEINPFDRAPLKEWEDLGFDLNRFDYAL